MTPRRRSVADWLVAIASSLFLRIFGRVRRRSQSRSPGSANASAVDPSRRPPDRGSAAVLDLPSDERAVSRRIAAGFAMSILAGLGLLVVYALGGQVQLEGALLGVAIGGIGVGLILWGKYLFPPGVVTEERGPHPSAEREVEAAERSFERGEPILRRTFLVRLLLGAVGALGLAAIFPIRSLGPSPGRSLFQTAWRAGSLLVTDDGTPVGVDALEVGGVVTVFPEGHTGSVDSAAVLVRTEPDALELSADRAQWAPEGNVCYSKICTHAGCPVGLYLAEFRQLQCPCHQSAFDVTRGAKPVFGPAARPLPQLPIYVDDQGYLRARGDFPEPVGPGFWNRGDEA